MSAPDLSPQFYDAWTAMARRLGADPLDLARVAYAETGMNPRAVDPRSNAGGLIGFMPFILSNLGWQGTPEQFRELSAVDQVPYVEAYYRPYAGLLRNDGLVYVANFLPARLRSAASGDDSYVLTRAGEVYYDANRILDRDGNGDITTGDLRRHLAIQDVGSRYQTIASELRARGAHGSVPSRSLSAWVPLALGALALGGYYLYFTPSGVRARQNAERHITRATRLLPI